MDSGRFDLSRFPVHLGLGARAERLPAFSGEMSWYERYAADHASDGAEGRLVTIHTISQSWDSWEVHPKGDELVVCLSGKLLLHQEIDTRVRRVELEPGQAVINPPGVWHTADVEEEATVLFVTAGLGTTHRPR
jgi:quercetin dioxygenase-like cupin family protein